VAVLTFFNDGEVSCSCLIPYSPVLAQEVTGTIKAADKNQVVRKLLSDSTGEYVAAFIPVGVLTCSGPASNCMWMRR
jgi:hypothetical protein